MRILFLIGAGMITAIGRILAFAVCTCTWQGGSAQEITTADITRFWEAHDALAAAKDHADSVACFQQIYLDRASEGLRRFMQVRDLSAERYMEVVHATSFWASIRANTLRIQEQKEAINGVFERYEREIPGFKRPSVCFAMGHLSTGGTTSGDWILIGSEIVCADSTTDTSELNAWLRSVIRPVDQVVAFIAHESVHIRQRRGPRMKWGSGNGSLLAASMMEGTADFVARQVAGISINEQLMRYGLSHEQELWREFKEVMKEDDITGWLYQGEGSGDRPADLGYFMGERIAGSYYHNARNKQKAMKVLLRTGAAGKVLRKSGYYGGR